jgi:WD40 repeat protein
MLFKYLFGDDIFISYSRGDGINYAPGLANELAKQDFSCFLDQWGTPPGEDLPRPLKRALARSRVLVLIGSDRAAASIAVSKEITEFVRKNRPIIPIDFEGALPKASWYPLIKGLALTPETRQALEHGTPSPQVISRIEKTFKFTRRNNRVRRTFLATALLLFLFLCASVYASVYARQQQRTAEAAAVVARDNARKAEEQRAIAESRAADLKAQTAELEKRTADLHKQEQIAQQNADKAQQQTEIAQSKAAEAKHQQAIAEERQQTAHARELASNAMSQLSSDPELGLLIANEAVKVKLTPESEDALRQSLAGSRLRLTYRGHTNWIYFAKFSPDGKYFLSASEDQTIRVWETSTGRTLITQPRDPLSLVGFSPDSKLVAVSVDREVGIWEIASGRSVSTLKGHDHLSTLTFTPDSKHVVTVDSIEINSGTRITTDGFTVQVHEISTGQKTADLQLKGLYGEKGLFGDGLTALRDDGGYFAATNRDGAVQVWEVNSGQSVATLPLHSGCIGLQFSPDHKLLAAIKDKVVEVYDVASGRRVASLEARTKFEPIINGFGGVVFSPDGKLVLAPDAEKGIAQVWEANTGRAIAVLLGHTRPVFSASFSPNGQYVVTASADTTARVWEVSTGESVAELRGHRGMVMGSEFSPDGKFVLTGSYDGTARLWEWGIDTKRNFVELEGHTREVTTVAFSPDGKLAMTTSHDHTVRVWEVSSGRCLAVLQGHTDFINTAAFSPDSRLVVTASYDKTARVWEANSGRTIAVLQGHTGHVYSAAFSPDNSSIVTASEDKTARVWAANSGRGLVVLTGHTGVVTSAEFTPDGKLIMTHSTAMESNKGDDTTRLWAVDTGRGLTVLPNNSLLSPNGSLILTIPDNGPPIISKRDSGRRIAELQVKPEINFEPVFSPDSKFIVTGVGDTAWVWEAATGRKISEMLAHSRFVGGSVFSPDGKVIVSECFDGVARVWEASSGRVVAELEGSGSQRGPAISPDGEHILTAHDNAARIYTCPECSSVEGLLRLVPTRVTRKLTPDERKQYSLSPE